MEDLGLDLEIDTATSIVPYQSLKEAYAKENWMSTADV
jgi:hypothetical protein